MNIQQALDWATDQLKSTSDSAKLDAQVLLQFVLQCNRTYLMTWPDKALSTAQQQYFEKLIALRQSGVPVAHITGEREFWSLPLKVTPDTLIPRPDTEVLVEAVLEKVQLTQCTLADLGTGTGAIALAIKSERPDWQVFAVDQSTDALAVAKQNAQSLGLDIECQLGDWLSCFAPNSLDVIVSNPPYIDEKDPHLSEGDVRFEPLSALVADNNGLSDIETIIEQATHVLKPGGMLFFEHGYQQAQSVQALLAKAGFSQIETVADYGGNPRVTLGSKN